MKLICLTLFAVAGIFALIPCHAQDTGKPEIFDRYSLEDKWDQSVEEIERAWDQSVGNIDEPGPVPAKEKQDKIIQHPAAGLKKNKNLIFQNKFDENMLENISRVEPSPAAPYSGLLIDARGTDLKPCLQFRLTGTSRGTLYGQVKPVPDLLQKKGGCGWAGSVKEALTYQRTGLNPMQLKAAGISDTHPVSIFIDDEKFDQNLRSKIDIFLKMNAVVIVF